MKEWKQLALAINVATKAHQGQYDKGGKPYILHPLHLMNQLMFDPQLATIAVLHDVVEDSDYTINTLRVMGFSKRVTDAVSLLTHMPHQKYHENYIADIATNYDAIRVKRKDLQHNSCITRLKGVTPKDHLRMEKYNKAFLFLGEAKAKFINKGE